MKIALKYCGGCNPAYERNNIVKWLKRDFQNIELSPLKENEKYDLILIICGCSAECVSEKDFDNTIAVVSIHNEQEYQKVKKYIIKNGMKGGKNNVI